MGLLDRLRGKVPHEDLSDPDAPKGYAKLAAEERRRRFKEKVKSMAKNFAEGVKKLAEPEPPARTARKKGSRRVSSSHSSDDIFGGDLFEGLGDPLEGFEDPLLGIGGGGRRRKRKRRTDDIFDLW